MRGTPDAEEFTVAVRDTPFGPVLAPAGELDCATVELLEGEFGRVLDERQAPAPLVVLDLTGLTFCDSAGLTALLRLRAACQRAGSDLLLGRPAWQVRRVLEITDTIAAFSVLPDLRAATT